MKRTKRIFAGIISVAMLCVSISAISASAAEEEVTFPETDSTVVTEETTTTLETEETTISDENVDPDFTVPAETEVTGDHHHDKDDCDIDPEFTVTEETTVSDENVDPDFTVTDETTDTPEFDHHFHHYNDFEDFDDTDTDIFDKPFDFVHMNKHNDMNVEVSENPLFHKIKGHFDTEFAGKFANIFHVNPETGEQEYAGSTEIDENGDFVTAIEDSDECIIEVDETDALDDIAVVAGDANKNGECEVGDLVAITKSMVDQKWLDNVAKKSCDVIKDGKVDIKDTIKTAQYLVGTSEF